MKYFILAFKRIADFQGRSSRKEFFMTYLFYILFTIPFILLKYILFMSFGFKESVAAFPQVAYSIVCSIPLITLGIRRIHDVGQSGWFILIPLFNIYLFLKKGETGINEYGPPPLSDIPSVITGKTFLKFAGVLAGLIFFGIVAAQLYGTYTTKKMREEFVLAYDGDVKHKIDFIIEKTNSLPNDIQNISFAELATTDYINWREINAEELAKKPIIDEHQDDIPVFSNIDLEFKVLDISERNKLNTLLASGSDIDGVLYTYGRVQENFYDKYLHDLHMSQINSVKNEKYAHLCSVEAYVAPVYSKEGFTPGVICINHTILDLEKLEEIKSENILITNDQEVNIYEGEEVQNLKSNLVDNLKKYFKNIKI